MAMAGGCHRSGRRVPVYVLRVRPLRAGLQGSMFNGFTGRVPFFFGKAQFLRGVFPTGKVYSLWEGCIPCGKGAFPTGKASFLEDEMRTHAARRNPCRKSMPGEAHSTRASACSPRPVGVSAGSSQRYSSRPALFRIRRFLFPSGKFPFPVGRDGCTLSGLEVLRLFAEESDHECEH
mgnify:CR=1 FL=1